MYLMCTIHMLFFSSMCICVPSMGHFIKDNHCYLDYQQCLDRTFIIAFGVDQIEGYAPTKYYLYDGDAIWRLAPKQIQPIKESVY